ncbi:phospholipase D-like domain-containing protein [Labrys okinawensis]|uniref:phospholipase D-like domain-containing protein n=1 Tax=Labrys okinawensis TaxID=346911 RepID=UPI0039BD4A68
MGSIIAAGSWCNGDVAYLAWTIKAPIPDCLGFMITRVHETGQDAGARRVLPTWISFNDQSNPRWLEQDSSVWPIQALQWRDLTLRKSRDTTAVRLIDFRVHYEIVPVGLAGEGRTQVPDSETAPYLDSDGKSRYDGTRRPLFILEQPFRTPPIDVTHKYGRDGSAIEATFTNGILSTQNLLQQLRSLDSKDKLAKEDLESTKGLLKVLDEHIAIPGDPLRTFLTGDALSFVCRFLKQAVGGDGEVCLALYELDDPELKALLKQGVEAGKVHLILSTASKTDTKPPGSARTPDRPVVWDTENNRIRNELHALDKGGQVFDRMFNNEQSIGHNKFCVYVRDGIAEAVMTGSTNWSRTGLCTQSNNAIIITNPKVADAYWSYWKDLRDDRQPLRVPLQVQMGPRKLVEGSAANQGDPGPELRNSNAKPAGPYQMADGTSIELWRSPNAPSRARNEKSPTPADLNDVYWLMAHAKKAIFFLTFMPGESGKQNIIGEAARLSSDRPELAILGAISDPRAMPPSSLHEPAAPAGVKVPPPAIWWPHGDRSQIAMIRAAAVRIPVGNLHPELLTAGHAIIHDKIIVIDPLDADNCVLITGSHNLGYKASYANDENLLIIRGNSALATAYAVHVLDIYDHYLFRAKLEERYRSDLIAGRPSAPNTARGFLGTDASWQTHVFPRPRSSADYFVGSL